MKKFVSLLVCLAVCLASFAVLSCGDDEDTDSYIEITIVGDPPAQLSATRWEAGEPDLGALATISTYNSIPFLGMVAAEADGVTSVGMSLQSSVDAILLGFNPNFDGATWGGSAAVSPVIVSLQRGDSVYTYAFGNSPSNIIASAKFDTVESGDSFVRGTFTGTLAKASGSGPTTVQISGKINLKLVDAAELQNGWISLL